MKHPLLTVGLIVDSVNAGRLVDKGPPAEDGPAARKFREFWGDKSELRRWVFCVSCTLSPNMTDHLQINHLHIIYKSSRSAVMIRCEEGSVTVVQVQPRNYTLHAIDHADYPAPTLEHELDHTDHTDQE